MRNQNLIKFIQDNPEGTLRSVSSHADVAYYMEFQEWGKPTTIKFMWRNGEGVYTQVVSPATAIYFRSIAGKLSSNYMDLVNILKFIEEGGELVENCNGALMTPDQLVEEVENY